MGRNIEFFMR